MKIGFYFFRAVGCFHKQVIVCPDEIVLLRAGPLGEGVKQVGIGIGFSKRSLVFRPGEGTGSQQAQDKEQADESLHFPIRLL